MYLLGYDIGSSSVKAALLDADSNKVIISAQYPKTEMDIDAPHAEWAEQDPDFWWKAVKACTKEVLSKSSVNNVDIKAIGISYQMHGLVVVDKNQQVLRPSIIWCDSRAVSIGDKAFADIGQEKCLYSMLNSPGNFTASKLAWVKQNEPKIYDQIDKFMLPGDFIAMKLSGDISTTVSGLSEGIFYDFQKEEISKDVITALGLNRMMAADQVPTFGIQSEVSASAAQELGLAAGTKISYRAGDQPNNALSLNVLRPGELATTAGTSGVVYAVSDVLKSDPLSRINTFAHVNHTAAARRLGILLCINGTGIMYAWAKRNFKIESYEAMNNLVAQAPIGADGLSVIPFGNGAERMLNNQNPGAHFSNLHLNRHNNSHIARAITEGIAFSFNYGIEIMKELGLQPKVMRAGNANLFLSPHFRTTLGSICGATIELYNTDGAEGAARGAGIGLGIYTLDNAHVGLDLLNTINPDVKNIDQYSEAYNSWKSNLDRILN